MSFPLDWVGIGIGIGVGVGLRLGLRLMLRLKLGLGLGCVWVKFGSWLCWSRVEVGLGLRWVGLATMEVNLNIGTRLGGWLGGWLVQTNNNATPSAQQVWLGLANRAECGNTYLNIFIDQIQKIFY